MQSATLLAKIKNGSIYERHGIVLSYGQDKGKWWAARCDKGERLQWAYLSTNSEIALRLMFWQY